MRIEELELEERPALFTAEPPPAVSTASAAHNVSLHEQVEKMKAGRAKLLARLEHAMHEIDELNEAHDATLSQLASERSAWDLERAELQQMRDGDHPHHERPRDRGRGGGEEDDGRGNPGSPGTSVETLRLLEAERASWVQEREAWEREKNREREAWEREREAWKRERVRHLDVMAELRGYVTAVGEANESIRRDAVEDLHNIRARILAQMRV
jgi:hypothetical protein